MVSIARVTSGCTFRASRHASTVGPFFPHDPRSRLEGHLCSEAKLLLEKFTENHISGVLRDAKRFQMAASGEKLAGCIYCFAVLAK